MKVWFRQIYIEVGVDFPFSHHFQRRLSREVSALVKPSPKFVKKYGAGFELTFNVSAKKALQDNEVKGPAVFKKTKDVEYTIFLPFKVIIQKRAAPRVALQFLLKGIGKVFDELEIDKAKLLAEQESLIDGICSDATMLEDPSWLEEENETKVRTLFEKFFGRQKKE